MPRLDKFTYFFFPILSIFAMLIGRFLGSEGTAISLTNVIVLGMLFFLFLFLFRLYAFRLHIKCGSRIVLMIYIGLLCFTSLFCYFIRIYVVWGIGFFFLGGTSLIMGMNSSESWGEYIRTSTEGASTASADAGPVPHGNTVSNSTEGPASPGRFPYEPDELIGGDSVLSIQRRLLASKPFPSAEEIDFARMQAEDLFEVKVQIIHKMQVLDPTGDWMRQGARALDSPNSATGESSLKRLYSFLEDIEQNGKTSRAFFSLSEKVALRKDDLDAGSSA
jgi:hypothetical protein